MQTVNHRKLWIRSIIITLVYISLSMIYLFGGYYNPVHPSFILNLLQFILVLPATIIFIGGYNEGDYGAALFGLFAVVVLYMIVAVLVYTAEGIRSLFRSSRSTTADSGNMAVTRPIKVPVTRQYNWPGVLYTIAFYLLILVIISPFANGSAYLPASIIYFLTTLLPQYILSKHHRNGMHFVRHRKFMDAIPHFEKSRDFFERHRWIDKYRLFIMGNVSAISYHEMALCNIGFCYGQAGHIKESKKYYEAALSQYPESGLATTALQFIRAAESASEETTNTNEHDDRDLAQ